MKNFSFTKAAFGVGLGFTLGSFVGQIVAGTAGKVFAQRLIDKAKEGDEFSKTVCEKSGIKIDSENAETETDA